jgi:hypothetical protein
MVAGFDDGLRGTQRETRDMAVPTPVRKAVDSPSVTVQRIG